jgi:Mn-containing catalase
VWIGFELSAKFKICLSNLPFGVNRLYIFSLKKVISCTSVGTEELGHLEMIGAIVYQLTRGLTEEEIKNSGFADYFVDHTTGIYPAGANGMPFTAAALQVKGDAITDLHENMAAEEKAC